MYIIHVGVRHCNNDTIICGIFECCLGCGVVVLFRFPYGVVVLFGTNCCDVPVLFISMFLQSSFSFCKFIFLLLLCPASLYVRLQL
jgi:hypothetical protein